MGLVYVFFGLLSGVLGGLGMGGGTVLIPLLTLFTSISQHTAQGLNLICFIPMSVVAILIHLKNKLIETKNVWFIIIPALISSLIGAIISKRLEDNVLRKFFGVFLIILGLYQLLKFFKERKK